MSFQTSSLKQIRSFERSLALILSSLLASGPQKSALLLVIFFPSLNFQFFSTKERSYPLTIPSDSPSSPHISATSQPGELGVVVVVVEDEVEDVEVVVLVVVDVVEVVVVVVEVLVELVLVAVVVVVVDDVEGPVTLMLSNTAGSL